MGTRAITHIFDRDKLLVTIYRQYDGYPTGHGQDILDALAGRKLVNGIPVHADPATVTNGMGCAAALLIANLKGDLQAGGIYVYPPDATAKEDYTYTLVGDTMKPEDGIRLKVEDFTGAVRFDGLLQEFDPNDAEGDG